MPYIPYKNRGKFDTIIDSFSSKIETTGELNYVLTRILCLWLLEQGLNYEFFNRAIGVLECIKQELYRRVGIGYEDIKIHQNGDVYPEELTRHMTVR